VFLLKGRFLVLPTNIKLGWTNTNFLKIEDRKSFIALGLGLIVIKRFSSSQRMKLNVLEHLALVKLSCYAS